MRCWGFRDGTAGMKGSARSSAAGARPLQGQRERLVPGEPAGRVGSPRWSAHDEIAARKPAESNRNPAGGSIRLANGARATARSSSRTGHRPGRPEPGAEGAGVEPGRSRATRFSGPVSAPRRPHLPELVPAAGIEPEAGCERPGTAPAVSRGRGGQSRPRASPYPARGIAPRRVASRRRSGSTGRDLSARVGSRTPFGPFRRRPTALRARAWSMCRDSNPGRARLQLAVNTRFAHAWSWKPVRPIVGSERGATQGSRTPFN
jgi:hypothetical protein